MSSPLFDELSARYGQPAPPPPTPYARQPAPQQQYRPPAYAPQPPPLCPRCSHADAPFGLVHRHLDEVVGYLITRINALEAHMSALDNLTAQVDNISQVLTGTVEPALAELASKTGTTVTGIPEADVQAQADRLSTLASGAASATQAALASAGGTAAPAPTPAG